MTRCRPGLALVALMLCGRAWAQEPVSNQVAGTVTEASGGVLVGAIVTLESATRARLTAATDGQGRYRFVDLQPGPYVLTVAAPGFMPFAASLDVRTSGSIQRDVSLAIGISVAVEVAGFADARRNASSLVLTARDIKNLPDDPRLFMMRLLEMAGSTGRRGDVAVYVDGFRHARRLPPKSAIDMIRINSNPFSAEFSQPSVKRIEITTKPGSDGFHGDITTQIRNPRLDSANPLTGTRPQGGYRNYSGYLQGPLQKERAGFLVYAGQWRQDDNAFLHATVLDPDTSLAQAAAATARTPTTATSAVFKIDWRRGRQLLNASYEATRTTDRNQGLTSGFDLIEHGFDRSATEHAGRFWWTTLGTHSLNDVRVEVTRSDLTTSPLSDTPAVLVLDAFNAGANPAAGLRSRTLGIQASETLTLVKGPHAIKMGARLDTSDQTSVDRTGFAGTFTFGSDVERDATGRPVVDRLGASTAISPIESYRRTLLGLRGYGPSQYALTAGEPTVGVSQWSAGWFALDDWSLSRRVMLSLGIRHDLQSNLRQRLALAPRGALSWLLDDKGDTALKFGAGLFYVPVEAGLTLDTRRFDGSRRRQLIVTRPAFFATVPASIDGATAAQSRIYTKADDLRMPYAAVSTATLERQLPRGVFLTAEYLFTRGFDQLRLREVAGPASIAGTRSPALQFESTGRFTQHELTTGIRADVSAAFAVFGNYKLGRKRSDTDGPYTVPADSTRFDAEYGWSIDDRRHQIVAGASVQAPGQVRVESELSVQSGRPFNITTGRDENGDTLFSDRPAFAAPGDAGAIATPFGVFNPHPQPGDRIIPRNYGREPWQAAVSLAVSRTFQGRLTMTAHAENLLNNRRFYALNGVLTSPVFGEANQTLNARRFELSARVGF